MEMRQSQPPRLALLLLSIALPRDIREYVAGDLQEEFIRCHRGRWWFWRQVLRSIPWLIEWPQPLVSALVAIAWLVVGWHVLWTFVLSQVPCKADPAGWGLFR